jgi:DNA mismatch repair protein MutL
LLVPETIELSAAESLLLRDSLDYLNSLGFTLEPFGGNGFLIRAIPAIATKTSAKQLIADLTADLAEMGKNLQLDVKKENLRKLVACHSAIKAGDKLSPTEINQLIKDLYATQNPLTCPHGRPTIFRLTLSEIKRRFLR